jgi:hypothetical protein
MLKADPNLAKPRRLMDEPNDEKSSVDMEDPIFASPYKEQELPMRINERIEVAEPR